MLNIIFIFHSLVQINVGKIETLKKLFIPAYLLWKHIDQGLSLDLQPLFVLKLLWFIAEFQACQSVHFIS